MMLATHKVKLLHWTGKVTRCSHLLRPMGCYYDSTQAIYGQDPGIRLLLKLSNDGVHGLLCSLQKGVLSKACYACDA